VKAYYFSEMPYPYVPEEVERELSSSRVIVPNSYCDPRVMADLAAAGIASRRGVMAIHLEPFYRSLSPGVSLPETERAAGDTVLLPLFAGMTVDEQDQVVEALALSLRSAAATARS